MESSEQTILQKHLARFIVGEVFNTITEEDILKIKAPGVWEHKSKLLSPGQVKALKSEAQLFKESGLWKILFAELQWLAYKRGYVESKTEADLIAGKLLTYLTNVINTKLNRMIDN